jgi:hypothetical protein
MATGLSLALDLCKKTREKCSLISVDNEISTCINKQQCMLLSNKLFEIQQTLDAFLSKLSDKEIASSGSPNLGPATQELVHVLKTAHETVSKHCFCNTKWM